MTTQNGLNLGLSGSTGAGSFVGSSGAAISSPQMSQINDTNGNTILSLAGQAGATNYLQINNNSTGNANAISCLGSDANIGLQLTTKGTGTLAIQSANTTLPLVVINGTGYQHQTDFIFANTAVTRSVTFPDADGTVSLLGNSSTGSGSVVLQTSPTITTPQIAQINDANGNAVFLMASQASAVNYIGVLNSSTSDAPQIFAAGAGTNLDIGLVPKGTGTTSLNTISNVGLKITSGTGYQHQTLFIFPNTSGAIQVTFQDTNGTVCVDSSASGSITTSPPVSAASTLALGTAYHNTLGYDIVLTVYVSVTAATAGSLMNGVGRTTTPTQQTIVSSLTVAAVTIIPVTIYLPSGYYALLSTGGTITATISGQQAMPV